MTPQRTLSYHGVDTRRNKYNKQINFASNPRLKPLRADKKGNRSINGSASQRRSKINGEKSTPIPPSTYDIDPLPDESKTSMLNFEMWPYDYFRSTRLLQGRSYARNTAFEKDNIYRQPNIQDLASPKQSNDKFSTLWSTTAFRFGIFLAAFFSFSPIVQFLNNQETIPLSVVDELTDNFSTGVSILYGTFISLTLNILYERQNCISEQIATESSLLVILTRNVLALCRNDEENMKVFGECIMDQVRILVKESRGTELITLIYADPYGRILDLMNVIDTNKSQKDVSAHGFFWLVMIAPYNEIN